jgi:hypothetical protein
MSLVRYRGGEASSDEDLSSSDESSFDESDEEVVAPASTRQIVHKSKDGQYSVRTPKVSSVDEAAAHGYAITSRDLKTGCVSNGMAIGVARQKGIEIKRQRTGLLKSLKEGRVTLADVVGMATNADSADIVVAGKIRLKSLLGNLPHMGRTKTKEILVLSSIDPMMTMRQLCSAANRRVLMRLVSILDARVPSLRGKLGMRVESSQPVE